MLRPGNDNEKLRQRSAERNEANGSLETILNTLWAGRGGVGSIFEYQNQEREGPAELASPRWPELRMESGWKRGV